MKGTAVARARVVYAAPDKPIPITRIRVRTFSPPAGRQQRRGSADYEGLDFISWVSVSDIRSPICGGDA
jgi:hypothetical protein